MSSGFKIICISIAVFAAIMGGMVAANVSFEKAQCAAVEEHGAPAVTTEWNGMVQGCYVTEDGKTFPLDKWRNVQ